MPLQYNKRKLCALEIEKLLSVINLAAILLIQTNTSDFTEKMIRIRMRRIANDLTVASNERGERVR